MTQRGVMPNGRLFHSPLGLYDFQIDAVAYLHLIESIVAVIDRGLGKTVIMAALAAQLFEDDEIDLVVCVAQAGKLEKDEFPRDWAEFTSLNVHRYLGTGRQQRLAKAQSQAPVDVLLTSYETGKLDLMTKVQVKRGTGRRDGPLAEALDLRHKRVLWLFDECIKLGNRGNELYRAYDYLLGPDGQLRRTGHKQRVIGLSANPMSTDWVQSENIGLIVAPERLPRITNFIEQFAHGRDDRGDLIYRREAETVFAPMFNQRLVYRKRSTDADVRHQMPELIEMPVTWVELEPEHRQLYDAVQDIYGKPWDELEDNQKGPLSALLRVICGHPRAILRSEGQLTRTIVAALGEDVIRSIPSSKTHVLLRELEKIKGRQALVFTRFAELVLPELVHDLRAEGYRVGTYLGKDPASLRDKQAFQSGEIDVLISGDAGARGLNLPQAQYIFEYESANTFETRMQRFGRGTRLVGGGERVFGFTLCARKTLEVGTIHTVLRRNDAQDHLLGDKGVAGYMDAAQRRRTLEVSRA